MYSIITFLITFYWIIFWFCVQKLIIAFQFLGFLSSRRQPKWTFMQVLLSPIRSENIVSYWKFKRVTFLNPMRLIAEFPYKNIDDCVMLLFNIWLVLSSKFGASSQFLCNIIGTKLSILYNMLVDTKSSYHLVSMQYLRKTMLFVLRHRLVIWIKFECS